MSIANLLLRPITSLVLLRFYNDRAGRYATSTIGFPGLGSFGSIPGSNAGTMRGSYEDIDGHHQSVPRSTLDTGSPRRDTESHIPPNYP